MMRFIFSSMVFLGVAFLSSLGIAQQRIEPSYTPERYKNLERQIHQSVKPGTLSVQWNDDGKSFEYRQNGKRYRFDLVAKEKSEVDPKSASAKGSSTTGTPGRRKRINGPARAEQFKTSLSPDQKHLAVYRNRNLMLSHLESHTEVAVTQDGNDQNRIKYASANWTYGEELEQGSAMWWSPDSRKIAFYRFDESRVPDYFLTLDHTKIQTRLDVEPYNKTGAPNPVVDLLVYDLDTRKTVTFDTRDGKPFDDSVVGHYLYGIEWSPDGRELLFHRTNRLQNIMELCAGDPATGKCRVIVREQWPKSWTENSPTMQFLEDGKRFVWASERTGWKNYYLYDLQGKLITPLTRHESEVGPIVRIDEKTGTFFYMARTGDNPLKLQLHRVGLDGQQDRRQTDPAFHHTVDLSPDGTHFIDIMQTHDTPPVTILRDAEGKPLAELAQSDLSTFDKLGLHRVQLLKFKAADGQTELYGMLSVPSNFNPNNKYPLLVSVYAGPGTVGAHETFQLPHPLSECGFLVASFDSRSASGRGKCFMDAIYRKLGQVDADDQAEGVKSLCKAGYVDEKRVGIFGTSFGGTMSAICLLRHPDVFTTACACSAVTDFRNYDTIYTERYMGLPQDNSEGYQAACLMNHVSKLRGRLMIYFGTADDNVHPSNSLQLIQALQHARKSFEVQIGPDQGHTSLNFDRMMEFFGEHFSLDNHREPSRNATSP